MSSVAFILSCCNYCIISFQVVTAILDPLTEAAQRVAPLLVVLRDQLLVPLRLILIPQTQMSEFPLQKFYRYVVGTDVSDVRPGAFFDNLPRWAFGFLPLKMMCLPFFSCYLILPSRTEIPWNCGPCCGTGLVGSGRTS